MAPFRPTPPLTPTPPPAPAPRRRTEFCPLCGASDTRGETTWVPKLHEVFWAFHRAQPPRCGKDAP